MGALVSPLLLTLLASSLAQEAFDPTTTREDLVEAGGEPLKDNTANAEEFYPGVPDRPRNLVVVSSTQHSISLKWEFSPSSGQVEGYQLYYVHENVTNVKNISKTTPSYDLQGLDPFTTYKLWLVAIVDGRNSSESDPILANTDVDHPSPPILTNVTCYDTGMIYVEWIRPERFDQSVDFYELYHRPVSESGFHSIVIQANADEQYPRFFIDRLAGNTHHVVKISAGTKSLSNPEKVWHSEPSEERTIYLPEVNCKTGLFETEFQGELSAGMIVGAVAAVLFLFLAVIGFVLWRQYFKAAYYYLDEPQRVQVPRELPNWEEELGPDGGKGAVPLDEFALHVSALHVDSDVGFAKEYEDIQKYCVKSVKATHDHSSHPENKCKNRYLNIVAYDQSRVCLMPIAGQKKTSDYINANYIDGYRQCNAYIGTQGPLEHTFEAFWRMVWEQNVFVIVMITNLNERGRRKCDQYWPKEDSDTYGNIEATLLKEETMANYTVRTIKIKHTKLKRKKGSVSEREIKQFHYTSWPDHGVPCHPLPVLTFIRKSVEVNPPDGGPIIVHCSAGVGRTGTYITIDAMLRQVQDKREFNIYGFLKHIRGQRNYLVQTEEQYIFVHDALLEATLSGNTEIARESLSSYIEKLILEPSVEDAEQDDNSKEKRLIDKQFGLLTSFTPSEYNYMSARLECNASKNRDPNLIPVESSRIPLAPKPGVEGSDYINASWLHGHNKLKEFILSQHPTQEVVEDFWRMLWDHNAQTVVLLSSIDLEGFSAFWPEKDGDYDLETFRVRFIEESLHEGHSTFDFVVSSQHDDYELAVRIIYCPEWPRNVPNLEEVFAVLKVVQDWHLEYRDGPLVVVDKYGGTDGATFCALTTLCKELETFNAIDVYQVTKLFHNKRPGIWKSPEDVLYLYKAMEALVASNRANPVHEGAPAADPPTSGGGGTVALEVEKSPAINGVGSASTAEHRLSSSTDWNRSNGLVKSNSGHGFESAATTTTTTDEETNPTTTMLRRHSLPNSNGCTIMIPNGVATSHQKSDDNEDEEEEEISETAALTSSNKDCIVESQL